MKKKSSKAHFSKRNLIEMIKDICLIHDIDEKNVFEHYSKVLFIQ